MSASENKVRRDGILDAAARLLVRYGFDKTSVDDIAREAGVSKGAIYLHFSSKDRLLEALIAREMKAYAEKWIALNEADLDGETIRGMYKNSLIALSSSALMVAVFKQDGTVLGNYLRRPDNILRTTCEQQTSSLGDSDIKLLQDAGAIRNDLDPRIIAHVMDMLAYGLVAMDRIMPRQSIPRTEDLIEGISLLMDRALTPEGHGNPEAAKATARQLTQSIRKQFEIETPRSRGESK